jgi:glucokinase
VPPNSGPPPVLLADIGGTHARFTLANECEFGPITTLETGKYGGAEAAIQVFLDQVGLESLPRVAALACAGPVERGVVQLTNSDWRIDASQLRTGLGIEEVILVNDFAAVAWAIPSLGKTDLFPIGGGVPIQGAPAVVLGPGTGLGVAGYVPCEGGATVIVGEGGHVTMPSATDREAEVLAALRKELGHVSAERVLSGEGLVRLYRSLAKLDGIQASARSATEITDTALDPGCPLSRATLDMFCDMLGTVAGNLALTFGACGGVYIAGGIAPKIRDCLAASRFRRRFEAKGRFRTYLARIPVWVVTHPEPGLLGLTNLVGRQATTR